ncbi:hypothetical protein GGF46_004760 [Coemansia sp. RSA 552]|nr:hypothetical protein GGF46_004760 [Coemansia sp. RSA 552]
MQADSAADSLSALLAAELQGSTQEEVRRLVDTLLGEARQQSLPARTTAAEEWDWAGLQQLSRGKLWTEGTGASVPAEATEGRVRLYSPQWGAVGAGTLGQLRRGSRGVSELVQQVADEGGWFWLDVAEPSDDEVEGLGRVLRLHPLTVEDIGEGGNKVECVGDYVYVGLMAPNGGNVAVVAKDRCMMTLRTGVAAEEPLVLGGRDLSGAVRGVVEWTSVLLGQAVKAAEAEARAAQQEDEQVGLGQLARVGIARRQALGIWRVARGRSGVLRELARLGLADPESGGRAEGLVSRAAACEVELARAHSAYMARLSLDVSRITMGLGLLSTRWLVLAATLLALQVVTMVFGQNIQVPWGFDPDQHTHDSLAAWLGILGSLLVAFGACVVVLRWMRWI